jgi:hypothetical protein
MNFVTFMTLFIVVYLLWFIGRWLVLPHLRIFPYIEPMWLWTTLYGIFAYIMNWIFLWILLYLIIVYITWIIIKNYVPDFPIPFQSILLGSPPWQPLERAGVLPLIDRLRSVFVSTRSLEWRLRTAGTAVGEFFDKAFQYIHQYTAAKVQGKETPSNVDYRNGNPSQNNNSNSNIPKNAVRKSSRPSPYEDDEVTQVQDEYLQCIEEESQPIYKDMEGLEKAQAITRNESAIVNCRIRSLRSYSKLVNNRIS